MLQTNNKLGNISKVKEEEKVKGLENPYSTGKCITSCKMAI